MDLERILAELRSERTRMDHAIAALEGLGGASTPRRGHPAKSPPVPATRQRRRTMSPAARKRISDAMKQRWAARKKAKA